MDPLCQCHRAAIAQSSEPMANPHFSNNGAGSGSQPSTLARSGQSIRRGARRLSQEGAGCLRGRGQVVRRWQAETDRKFGCCAIGVERHLRGAHFNDLQTTSPHLLSVLSWRRRQGCIKPASEKTGLA